MIKKILQNLILFFIMGMGYLEVEIIWRGHSHWTMIIVGGLCGVLVGLLNESTSWDMSLIRQGLRGATLITFIEFLSGCILNLWLQLSIWDYSDLPFNILGQICVPFYIAWFFLSIIVIFLDDYLRWKLFGEEKPYYFIL